MGVLVSQEQMLKNNLKALKMDFMNRKLQESKRWETFCFGISAIGVFLLTHFCYKGIERLTASIFADSTGFGVCGICNQEKTDILVKKCRHFSHCHQCEQKMSKSQLPKCLRCRKEYQEVLRIYV